jgi:hypothetical protein
MQIELYNYVSKIDAAFWIKASISSKLNRFFKNRSSGFF